MLKAESLIATALMGLSIYFMVHATVLPIGWVQGSGPGGGAFPFWLSAIMLACSGGILLKSFAEPRQEGGPTFFDRDTIVSVASVALALVVTIAVMGWLGTYVALPLFMLWYLKVFGRHGWVLTGTLTVCTTLFLFFFFEVTLKILLPKGLTEPLFIPLYAIFF